MACGSRMSVVGEVSIIVTQVPLTTIATQGGTGSLDLQVTT